MEKRELLRELDHLGSLPNTVEDWRDLHETIEAYQRRRLARAIASSPRRVEIVATIEGLAADSEEA